MLTDRCPLWKSVIIFEREQFIIILMIGKQFTMNHILTDPQDKLKHEVEAFQNYYLLSFNEGNLYLMLFVFFAYGASFSLLLRRPSRLIGYWQMGLHVGQDVGKIWNNRIINHFSPVKTNKLSHENGTYFTFLPSNSRMELPNK